MLFLFKATSFLVAAFCFAVRFLFHANRLLLLLFPARLDNSGLSSGMVMAGTGSIIGASTCGILVSLGFCELITSVTRSVFVSSNGPCTGGG